MNPIVRTVTEALERKTFDRLLRRSAKRLERAGSAESTQLSQILREVLRGDVSRQEEKWWSAIEQERDKLHRDDTELVYQDHGTGDGSQLPGTTVTRTVAELANSSAPDFEGRLLFRIARAMQPDNCLELGTCLGISAAYVSAALRLNEKGRLYSIEGGEQVFERAKSTLTNLHLPTDGIVCGVFGETLPWLLPQIESLQFVYIDGHHDGEAMQKYVDEIFPRMDPGSVLIVDDLTWSKSMRLSWKNIRTHERVACYADILTLGICYLK